MLDCAEPPHRDPSPPGPFRGEKVPQADEGAVQPSQHVPMKREARQRLQHPQRVRRAEQNNAQMAVAEVAGVVEGIAQGDPE